MHIATYVFMSYEVATALTSKILYNNYAAYITMHGLIALMFVN